MNQSMGGAPLVYILASNPNTLSLDQNRLDLESASLMGAIAYTVIRVIPNPQLYGLRLCPTREASIERGAG